jgi:type I restriction enzyme S subunit
MPVYPRGGFMMQRYQEYKDSGVQWLGEIPSHWKTSQFKGLFKIIKNIAHKSGLEVISVTQQGLKIKDVKSNIGQIAADYSKYQMVEPDDFAMNHMDLLTGFIGLSSMTGVTSPDYRVFRNNSPLANNRYYLRIFEICYKRKIFYGLGQGVANVGRWRLPAKNLQKFVLPIPPLSEQQSIVAYIDSKSDMLDKMVEGKEKQIALLQELKQRTIADAVTKGLNPKVKFKATQISWLKEIPEHWKMVKMKYLFTERSDKNHPDEPMLSATQTEGVILQSKYKNRVVQVNKGFEGLKLVKVGDFVIHLRSFQGGIEYAYDQGIISSAYTVLFPNNYENSLYFKYLMKSSNFIDLLRICVTGIREGQNINYSKLKQYQLPLPPLSEQQAIVSYINDRTTKIDTLISKLQQEIEAIKEYKQRLISDVVTGQIKVC